MSDFNDDAAEWANATEGNSDVKASRAQSSDDLDYYDEDEEGKVEPGQPVQYAIYRQGYTPTTRTVNTLPSGIFEINVDQNCTYVTPIPKPAGLLLELPEMRSEAVIKVIDNFWESEKDYKEGNDFVIGGAAYKAGVMIYGPPGSGKSCTIKIVTNKMIARGGTVFYASSNPKVVSGFLTEFAQIEKNRKCIVILEDIDSLIQNYGESGYLDMLDSAKSIDNVLFIATTNYPDRLDPRIYNRPGRFSHVIKIGMPTRVAREAYLKAILKDHRDVRQIVDLSDGFSIDHITALVNAVYREKKELLKEANRIRTLFKIPETSNKSMGISGRLSESED